MKRQAIAIVLGSLFALPALASYQNYEIDAGSPVAASVPAKSAEQVRAELVAAKQSGNWMENSELGTVNRLSKPVLVVGKSRDEVRAETAQAFNAGEMIANAELGITYNQL